MMGEQSVKAVEEDKLVSPQAAAAEPADAKTLVVVDKVASVPSPEKGPVGSINRDSVLAQVETEKRNSLIKAWEESQKSKAENKAEKQMSSISSWENIKQASIKAELKKMEEALEKREAQYAEEIKNKIVMIHKAAEEKRAMVEAKRGEDLLKVDEAAAKYRATGIVPKKGIGCFGSQVLML